MLLPGITTKSLTVDDGGVIAYIKRIVGSPSVSDLTIFGLPTGGEFPQIQLVDTATTSLNGRGGFIRFQSNNTSLTGIPGVQLNGGLVSATAGNEQGDLDIGIYVNGAVKVVALSGPQGGTNPFWGPGDNNLWDIGRLAQGWKDLYLTGNAVMGTSLAGATSSNLVGSTLRSVVHLATDQNFAVGPSFVRTTGITLLSLTDAASPALQPMEIRATELLLRGLPLNMGQNAVSTGQINLANGGGGGATVTMQNNAATVAYNWNLPATAGTSGAPLLSGGGVSSPMTFGTVGVAFGGTNCTSASGTCLDNITGFSSTGMMARTGSGTYAFRTVTGTSPVAVTNGDGVSGNPTIACATCLTTAQAGQYPGTTTNDNASAGNVGEYIFSTQVGGGSAIVLSSGVAANITSISLTAGDWDVSANMRFSGGATTTVNAVIGSISATTNTLDETDMRSANQIYAGGTPFLYTNITNPIGPARFSLAGTTTVYLVGYCVFAVAACDGWGTIRARRVR
jgi:hypothetical protein